EADALRFDVALTVCAMRYISDLHIGKVNPRHFDFGLDVETKKYDLSDFLKDHVVDGSDVTGALAQVEPAYPGYKRTIAALHTYLELAKQSDDTRLPFRRRLSHRVIRTQAFLNSLKSSGLWVTSRLTLWSPLTLPSIKARSLKQSRISIAAMAVNPMDESARKPWPILTSRSPSGGGRAPP